MEPYYGRWRKNETRKLMKARSMDDLKKRVERTISTGYKIISNPEYQESSDVMGKITYFCLLEKI